MNGKCKELNYRQEQGMRKAFELLGFKMALKKRKIIELESFYLKKNIRIRITGSTSF